MSSTELFAVRDRLLPMLQAAADRYRDRVPPGYPVIHDAPERGMIGIELDPGYGFYVVSDGAQLWADVLFRTPRSDARSSASREKFGGAPFDGRRPLSAEASDQELRNLVAELMSRWNFQPGIIHVTDT